MGCVTCNWTCHYVINVIKSTVYIPGSTDLGPILFAHAVQAWANVVITQGIAQGMSNIGPGLDRARKQYWAKIVKNFATRVCLFIVIITVFVKYVRTGSGCWSDPICCLIKETRDDSAHRLASNKFIWWMARKWSGLFLMVTRNVHMWSL